MLESELLKLPAPERAAVGVDAGSDNAAGLRTAIANFYTKFSHKSCCFLDLAPYVNLVPAEAM